MPLEPNPALNDLIFLRSTAHTDLRLETDPRRVLELYKIVRSLDAEIAVLLQSKQ